MLEKSTVENDFDKLSLCFSTTTSSTPFIFNNTTSETVNSIEYFSRPRQFCQDNSEHDDDNDDKTVVMMLSSDEYEDHSCRMAMDSNAQIYKMHINNEKGTKIIGSDCDMSEISEVSENHYHGFRNEHNKTADILYCLHLFHSEESRLTELIER